VGAIAAAVIAGIVSLPALLGSDRPPPVPPDVGLRPPPAQPVPAVVPPAPDPAASPRPGAPGRDRRDRRLAARKRRRERSRRKHQRPRRRSRAHGADWSNAAPSPPPYAPPVYSHVPPPSHGEFEFER
jgi:hypothetical protein